MQKYKQSQFQRETIWDTLYTSVVNILINTLSSSGNSKFNGKHTQSFTRKADLRQHFWYTGCPGHCTKNSVC